jgi:hypothetical protein
VPLLQMHDSLECSVTSLEQAERVAQLGREVVATLEVPMQTDLGFGRNWGDAKHTWAELNGTAPKPPRYIEADAPIETIAPVSAISAPECTEAVESPPQDAALPSDDQPQDVTHALPWDDQPQDVAA